MSDTKTVRPKAVPTETPAQAVERYLQEITDDDNAWIVAMYEVWGKK